MGSEAAFPNIENVRGKLERGRRSVEGLGSRVAVANGFEAAAKRRTICNIVKSAREKSTYVRETGETSDGAATVPTRFEVRYPNGEELLNCFYVHDSGRIVPSSPLENEVFKTFLLAGIWCPPCENSA